MPRTQLVNLDFGLLQDILDLNLKIYISAGEMGSDPVNEVLVCCQNLAPL